MVRVLLELCRISNLPTVWTNVLAAWILASGGAWVWSPALGWLLLGASLVYCAGMTLNDACDAAWDREHRKERPVPSGKIGLGTVWGIGVAGLAGGAALMIWAGGADWRVVAGLVAAIMAYDLYHKPWAGSVIVMGACRALLYFSIAAPAFASLPRMMQPHTRGHCGFCALTATATSGVFLAGYIVGLSLLARAEGRGKVSALERLFLMALLYAPLPVHATMAWYRGGPPASPLNWFGWVFPFLALTAWTTYAIRHMSKGGPAIGAAVGMLLAGIPLVDAVAISSTSWPAALVFCALPPLLRYWQRWVAAT